MTFSLGPRSREETEKHKRTREMLMEREVEEKQVRTGAINWRLDVGSERHHVDRGDRLWGLQRWRHVSDFPQSQQNGFARQGKYTASHSHFSKIHTYMHSHTLIIKSLQSSTWQQHTNRIFFFPFSVSHKATCTPDSKRNAFIYAYTE